jgi:hypothetical protein
MNAEPRSWFTQRLIWGAAILFLTLIFVVRSYPIQEDKAQHFSKAKEARRGKIRLAKEGKRVLNFTQQRFGVSRLLWIQDEEGLRRQFFLEAPEAKVGALINASTSTFQEVFSHPKGWLQEELFWEIASTGERVVRRGTRWVREGSNQPVPESLYRDIVPAQKARFFDAETAEWNPLTNQLVAHTAFFSILKAKGHDLPTSTADGLVLAEGTTQSITFLFDKTGRQHVCCQGVKLLVKQKR